MKITYYDSGDGMVGRLTPEYGSMYFKREGDEAKLWVEIGKFLSMLMSRQMEAKVHDEGVGVVVQWNYDSSWGDTDLGNDRLMWVSTEEEDLINDHRQTDIDSIVKRLAESLNN